MDARRSELLGVMAEVNARIAQFAAGWNVGGDGWEFVCECGRPGCFERVEMSLAEFGALRQSGELVLAPGHRRARLGKIRAEVRVLVEEAKTLRAEARQRFGARKGHRDAADLAVRSQRPDPRT